MNHKEYSNRECENVIEKCLNFDNWFMNRVWNVINYYY